LKVPSGIDNTKTLVTFGTQNTGNIWHTRHRTKTIQRHWQHLAHKTQDKDNTKTLATFGTQDTDNIWHTRYWQHLAHKTQDEDKENTKRNTTQKIKKMSNTDTTKNRE
jgi:hypothetical protein